MALTVRKKGKKRGGMTKSSSKKRSSSKRTSSKKTTPTKAAKLRTAVGKTKAFLKTRKGRLALAGTATIGAFGLGSLANQLYYARKRAANRAMFVKPYPSSFASSSSLPRPSFDMYTWANIPTRRHSA